jgi:glycosyltransferase involved in cell wall biosynthesis
MAVLEAMAAGLPVVGTEPNGAPHVVLDGETGFVVKNNEGDAFAKRIVQLLLNPEFAKRFGAAGKARMHEQFSHVSMVDQLDDVYAEFVADAR